MYSPKKRHKFGIKLYEVCESSSGYCIGFHVYSGSADPGLSGNAERAGVSFASFKTTKIVIDLLAKTSLLNKGHRVYMDNCYTSPDTADGKIHVWHFTCESPWCAKSLSRNLKLKQGDCLYRRNDNILIFKYHDERDINVISTFHSASVASLTR